MQKNYFLVALLSLTIINISVIYSSELSHHPSSTHTGSYSPRPNRKLAPRAAVAEYLQSKKNALAHQPSAK